MRFRFRIHLCLLASLLMTGCGGVWTKTVGNEKTYYKDGQEISEQQAAAENSVIAERLAAEQRQAEYQALLEKAPRRGASEPVSIALLPAEVQPGFKIDHAKLNDYWQKSFRNQRNYPLVSNKKIKRALEQRVSVAQNRDWASAARARNLPGDVYVQLFVTTGHLDGYNKKTKKLVSQKVLLYRAEIGSSLTADKIVIEEPVTNLFKNVAHLQTLAQNVRDNIEADMRYRLPSAAWLKENNPNSLKNILQAFKDHLDNQNQ